MITKNSEYLSHCFGNWRAINYSSHLGFTESDESYAVPINIDFDWCDTWDGLLWRFVANNQDALSQISRTDSLVKTYKRLNEDRKRIISYRAQDFLNSL